MAIMWEPPDPPPAERAVPSDVAWKLWLAEILSRGTIRVDGSLSRRVLPAHADEQKVEEPLPLRRAA